MYRVDITLSNISKPFTTTQRNPTSPSLIMKSIESLEKKTRVLAHPDREVTGAKATEIVSGLMRKKVKGWPDPDANLTRGEAVQLIYQQLRQRSKLK